MVAIDMSKASATPPPRKTAAKRQSTAANKPVAQTESNVDRRTYGLMGTGQLAQGICLLTGQHADAMAIQQHWPNVAPEIAKMAEEYEWMAKGVDILIAAGPFTALFAALLPFGLQIAANHKLVDAKKMVGQGVVPPEILASQMQARVAQMQAEALRDQQNAMREAQEMQAEYEAMVADAQKPIAA